MQRRVIFILVLVAGLGNCKKSTGLAGGKGHAVQPDGPVAESETNVPSSPEENEEKEETIQVEEFGEVAATDTPTTTTAAAPQNVSGAMLTCSLEKTASETARYACGIVGDRFVRDEADIKLQHVSLEGEGIQNLLKVTSQGTSQKMVGERRFVFIVEAIGKNSVPQNVPFAVTMSFVFANGTTKTLKTVASLYVPLGLIAPVTFDDYHCGRKRFVDGREFMACAELVMGNCLDCPFNIKWQDLNLRAGDEYTVKVTTYDLGRDTCSLDDAVAVPFTSVGREDGLLKAQVTIGETIRGAGNACLFMEAPVMVEGVKKKIRSGFVH